MINVAHAPFWFEEMAEKFPWFKELLRKIPFEKIDKELGEYKDAYQWLCQGTARGWPSCIAFHYWKKRQEEKGRLEYWYKLFGLEEKWKKLQEREAREAKEEEENDTWMLQLLEEREAAEKAAYERIVRG